MNYQDILDRIEKMILNGDSFAKMRPFLDSIFEQAEAESNRLKKLAKENKVHCKTILEMTKAHTKAIADAAQAHAQEIGRVGAIYKELAAKHEALEIKAAACANELLELKRGIPLTEEILRQKKK
jgi:multidrug resistance efflux pump